MRTAVTILACLLLGTLIASSQTIFKNVQQPTDLISKLQHLESLKTANQDLFDVKYYGIDLKVDPVAKKVSGTVTVKAQVTGASMSQMELNLVQTDTVQQVVGSGRSLAFKQQNDILAITLDRTYAAGEYVAVAVTYKFVASGAGVYFETSAGQPLVYTSTEDDIGAKSWIPCKDLPSDKADSADIKITVPSNLIVASNGLLVATYDSTTTKTYWWHEGYPIATYLISFAAHPYKIHTQYYKYSPTDSMQIQNYVLPANLATAPTTYAKVPGMIKFMSDMFGQYPFMKEKYGHAEVINFGGAMEHQTCTTIDVTIRTPGVIAHELAHHWAGDLVTLKDWSHMWLNESFAPYMAIIWFGNEYGQAAFNNEMSNPPIGPGKVVAPTNANIGRGIWVLHMLRHVVGDTTFFNIMKSYFVDPRFKYVNATTDDFTNICQQVSKKDLRRFFDQWIYKEYCPTYVNQYTSTQNGSQYVINLTIQQVQFRTNTIFQMPIDVTVRTRSGETTFVVYDSLQTQSFQLTISEPVLGITLDKDNWILKDPTLPVTNPTFDRGILLVNGVDFPTYTTEITSAYVDKAFSGKFPITFWDCFATAPTGGYPSTLPAPIGRGSVTPDVLGKYSTVIWLANEYNGDEKNWMGTPLLSYVRAGGNLVLLTRWAWDFLDSTMCSYLGITWAEGDATINSCVATYPGLANMRLLGNQINNDVFSKTLTNPESKLLFTGTGSFTGDRGIGVWRKPTGGGTIRSTGGQFVFIAGRPYRWNHADLRANMEFILEQLMGEKTTTGVEEGSAIPLTCSLSQNYPNPFNPTTTFEFRIANRELTTLKVFDVLGREIATLVNEVRAPGAYTVRWDASSLSSGVYFYKLEAGDFTQTRKLLLLK
jgi:aminopeptidase N